MLLEEVKIVLNRYKYKVHESKRLRDTKIQQQKRPKHTPVQTPQESFLSVVKNYSKETGDIENQLMKYYKEPSACEKLSIHNLVSIMQNKPQSAQVFIEFCKQMMHSKSCEEAALATIEQSSCPLWYELRYARITASKAYEAAHCKTLDGSLTENIMGATKLKDTDAMKRGRNLESEVIKVVLRRRDVARRRRRALDMCPGPYVLKVYNINVFVSYT